ncbi:hypothetical protein M413DRAFT_296950 [Hebeloma cylindrosporum]|uniref:Uncharacterized protein n=1 Tax=Hebeloma cylindrosporum TaxID=76867 RepID=A0A0C3CAQ1_HEBCY|nr:hypothetical protein M413DRAFT_296950 [Hebeloma cylindrosporum h7]
MTNSLQNSPLLNSRCRMFRVRGGCGSFYAITIASHAFNGLPIVTAQVDNGNFEERNRRHSWSADKDYCTIDYIWNFINLGVSFVKRHPHKR